MKVVLSEAQAQIWTLFRSHASSVADALQISQDNKLCMAHTHTNKQMVISFAGDVVMEPSPEAIGIGTAFGIPIFLRGDNYKSIWSSIFVPAWGLPIVEQDALFTTKQSTITLMYNSLTGARVHLSSKTVAKFQFTVSILELHAAPRD